MYRSLLIVRGTEVSTIATRMQHAALNRVGARRASRLPPSS
jgi:hypothetical protein